MLLEAMSKSKRVIGSLTGRILTLCTSERFGLREAIAEAMRHEGETKRKPARHRGSREKTR